MPRVKTPELSIVVPSHDRPVRLRWLLNALERQTLDRSLWEVCVCHDSVGRETDELLERHPLAEDGTLRHTRLEPGTAPPGANRNAALKLAQAPTIVFTDDDCRPPETWLETVQAAVSRHPGAIVQGPVWGDPEEDAMRECSYYRTQDSLPVPRPWAECCNIVYPREAIERAGGFPEDVYTGEDTDLNLRAVSSGTPYVGESEMLTYHAIEEQGLLDQIKGAWRWQDLPLLCKRHPELREHLPLWVFWKRTHVWLPLALVGLAVARRNALGWLLVVPWATQRPDARPGIRGRLRYLTELPGWALIDISEIAALTAASVRHRSVLV